MYLLRGNINTHSNDGIICEEFKQRSAYLWVIMITTRSYIYYSITTQFIHIFSRNI